MKRCRQCGREWPDNANFCSSCGTWLSGGTKATQDKGALTGAEDKLEEGGLTTMEGVNLDNSTIFTAEEAEDTGSAGGSPVQAAPEEEKGKQKKQKVWKRTRTGEIRMGFFRWLALMILSALLLAVAAVSAAVYIVWDSSNTDAMEHVVGFIQPASIKASDIVIGGSGDQRFCDWLSDALFRSFGGQVDVTGSELRTVIERSNLRTFLAEKGVGFFNDIYAGTPGSSAITRAAFAAKLMENADLVKSELGLELTPALSEQLASWFESAGFFDIVSSAALNKEVPLVFTGLRYGLGLYGMIAYGVLALLLILLMTAVGKSFLRTVKCFSVIAILVGLVLCLGGLCAAYAPALWEMAFMGNYLASALVGGFLYYHLLIPSACILGGGILLRLLVALIRSVKIGNRLRAAATVR